MNRFDSKVVLVTGAATGIGLATVHRIRAEGGIVFAGVLSVPDDIDFAGAESVVLDVTNEQQWHTVIRMILEKSGRLDVLVNNAGIRESNRIEDTNQDQWQRLIDTNLKSVFLGCKAAIPAMRASGGGAIVNLGSITGIRSVGGMVAYSASKSGITALTSSLAIDHATDGIRVNAVCPGAISTQMVSSLIAEADDHDVMKQRIIATHPLGRIGRPDEVASVIAFLASDDASFMTGLSIPVDGGRSIR